jgi:non-ribosomal peptide synthetase-like protein
MARIVRPRGHTQHDDLVTYGDRITESSAPGIRSQYGLSDEGGGVMTLFVQADGSSAESSDLDESVGANEVRRRGADTLVDIFAETVAAFPNAIALDDGRRRLSYEQLGDAASAFADRLAANGVGRGDRVGIQMPSGNADLYVAVLGVLFAGAAYVPVDFDDPSDRANSIWETAGVSAVVTSGLVVEPCRRGPARKGRIEPGDDCWVIFTSGSTGTPKAVVVTHRAAAAFVNAETRLWTVTAHDRVLAGLSVGFDASCEEMWLAWRNGAALVPCPRDVVQSGVDLGPWLVGHAVSVISTVPTLAALWDDDVLAGVHLLILGGEACSAELGWRLAGQCEVWNTYGPTEATVVTTAARIVHGQPIAIGDPLEGWDVAIVDETGTPVASGEIGELVIAGIGLGRYLDPSLDAAGYRALPSRGWARAYRTGDRVRMAGTGLEFVGRSDDQVKISGRRVELGEIDAQLAAVPGVRSSASAVRYSDGGNPILVGYVVGDIEVSDVRAALRRRLPEGIVPMVVRLDEFPVKCSGKVDRDALPWPPPAQEPRQADPDAPASSRALSETESWLAEQWIHQLGWREISPKSNFFELGGASIAAAKLVSVIRGRFPNAAVADVYTHRQLSDLAEHLDHLARPSALEHEEAVAHQGWRGVQLAGVGLLIVLSAMQWLVGLFAYDQWFGTGLRVGWIAVIAGWLVLLSAPGRAMIVIAARRVLLAHLKPGRYRRQGWLSMRIWFVERLTAALHVDVLGGTPWAARYARMNGVDVGEGARLATLPSPTGLLSIGAGATLEGDVDARSWWIVGHELIVGEIRVGAGTRVGTRAVLMPGADVGLGAEIEPGSVISGRVPDGERWSGSPAKRVGIAGEHWPEVSVDATMHPRATRALFSLGLLILSVVPLIAAIPEIATLQAFGSLSNVHDLARTIIIDAPLFATLYLVSYALLVAAAIRSVSRLIRPGWHADSGTTAWALWFSDALLGRARDVLFPLYASVYTRSWLRMLGIHVGKRTEVSTAVGLNRHTSLGETSFFADDVVFAGARSRGGCIEVTPIEVGNRSFLGNGAILGSGTRLGNDSLVGILSSAPQTSADGTSWFGLPPIELPRIADRADPARTTTPPKRLIAARGAIELVRFLLPTTVSAILGGLMFLALEAIGSAHGVLALVLIAPEVLAVASLGAVAFTIVSKWLLIGRYKAGDHPLWSSFVWRDELVNTLQERLAGPWLLEFSVATPILSTYFRALGATIGKGVWIECLNVTEFDLVHVEDGCSVNRGACIDTHLVHDRIMRMGPALLGGGSTLGPESAVLPDTIVGAGCIVGARSVVMRGEQLPPHTSWHGLPVQSQ